MRCSKETILRQSLCNTMQHLPIPEDQLNWALEAIRLGLKEDVTIIWTIALLNFDTNDIITIREYSAKMTVDVTDNLILYGTHSAADDASDIVKVCNISEVDFDYISDQLDYMIDTGEADKAFNLDDDGWDLISSNRFVFTEKRIRFF